MSPDHNSSTLVIVFQRSGAPLPANLATYPTQVAHAYLQAIRKGGLVRRMNFGRRSD